jgi:hypothetical protein
MVLPSYELLSLGVLNDQASHLRTSNLSTFEPFARNPCATLYSGGQGYNGHVKLGDTSYTPNRSW